MVDAERCQRLAILETGTLRTQGTPQDLMAQLEGRVVKISGGALRQVKDQVLSLERVQSAAQQGTHLRVLLQPGTLDPVQYLRGELREHTLQFSATSPSLEDVFVASTREEHNP